MRRLKNVAPESQMHQILESIYFHNDAIVDNYYYSNREGAWYINLRGNEEDVPSRLRQFILPFPNFKENKNSIIDDELRGIL